MIMIIIIMPYSSIPWRYANVPIENSPQQWKAILWAHLSRGMIDCDWLNCPEKRAIHLVNDVPPGRKWPENLAAFHTVKKRGWSSALCLAAVAPLPPIHINSLLWHGHMILHRPECLLDTLHACVHTNESTIRFSCWRFLQKWKFGENIQACFIFPSVS